MSEAEVLTMVKELVGAAGGVDPARIADDGELVDYGLDSVKLINLLMAIEDRFAVVIAEDDPELPELATVRQLAQFVERKL